MKYTLIFSLILSSFFSNAQNKIGTDSGQVGIIKTTSDKTLGYGFVAMNENVVFTAAHNISLVEPMIFVDINGNTFPLNIVASDPTGDIGVLLATKSISKTPYVLNLNYAIDLETELFIAQSSDKKNGRSDNLTLHTTTLKEKTSKIQKKKEFKSITLQSDFQTKYSGMPVLNKQNEVIGIAIEVYSNNSKDKTRSYKVSILDSDLWKKM